MQTTRSSHLRAKGNDPGIPESTRRFLKAGGWLIRVGYNDAERFRCYARVSDDMSGLHLSASPKGDNNHIICFQEVVGMSFGAETTAFSRVSKSDPDCLPWKCFSLIFVGKTLDLCCVDDDAQKWFISLQQVVSSFGLMLLPLLSRAEVVRRKVLMKIRFKARMLGRSLVDHIKVTIAQVSSRYRELTGPAASVLSSFSDLRSELEFLRQELVDLQNHQMDLVSQAVIEIFQRLSIGKQQGQSLRRRDDGYDEALSRANSERKRLHNELMELKGNIRVFVRVRPFLPWEEEHQNESVTTIKPDRISVYNESDARKRAFEFDHIFPPPASQEDVYAQVEPFIRSFLDGFNVCLFAYGVTNSGKTYTMEGVPGESGVIGRSLASIFSSVAPNTRVSCSCVQIYNEAVYDLLNDMAVLELRNGESESFYAQNVKQVGIDSLEDATRLLRAAAQQRSTNSTRLNQSSSRSHFVVTVHLSGPTVSSKLNLVDLAGSENVNRSGASGSILTEAKNINRSLSALGDVIHSLLEARSHIPFRNSKLTMLLRDSLQGNSKTVMIVQASPTQADVVETLGSLQFASRVRTVELGKPKRNISMQIRE